MLENGQTICDCKKTSCKRHGNCKECIEYHSKSKRLPYCKRQISNKNLFDIIRSKFSPN